MANIIERRQEDRHKAKLIARLGSEDRQTALRALWEIRAYGWLWDGTLARSDLSGTNLSGGDLSRGMLRKVWLVGAQLIAADLSEADLEGSDLSGADLTGAQLRGANLRWANLSATNLTDVDVEEAVLCRCGGLVGATMPDGSRYDGRYRLPDDLDPLQLAGLSADDARLADWYDVPGTAFAAGQRWAEEHLPRLRP